MTILSVNKTRELDGRIALIFCLGAGTFCAHFFISGVYAMSKHVRYLAHGAIIAALYAVLTHLQNILIPNSASFAIQMRLSEALCVLAFFTPAAPLGLSVGCLVFNLTFAAALPTDFLVGTLATYLAAKSMWLSRRVTHMGIPFLGLLMPALFNALLVGWELSVYIGGGFWINALSVAIGEAAVLFFPGMLLYCAMRKRKLDVRLFHTER